MFHFPLLLLLGYLIKGMAHVTRRKVFNPDGGAVVCGVGWICLMSFVFDSPMHHLAEKRNSKTLDKLFIQSTSSPASLSLSSLFNHVSVKNNDGKLNENNVEPFFVLFFFIFPPRRL